MKILILSILVAVVVDGSKRDEIYQLANSAVEEIAKRENMDLYLESLDSYRTKVTHRSRSRAECFIDTSAGLSKDIYVL